MNELDVVNIRMIKERSLHSMKSISSPIEAVELVAKEMAEYDREVMCILNLQTDNRVINLNFASMGTLNASLVSGREIFKSSILSNSASIIMMHNHPSGNALPSRQDIDVTKRMIAGGEVLGIGVLDHIIVEGGTGEFYSFKEQGMMPEVDLAAIFRENKLSELNSIQQYLSTMDIEI